MFSFLSGKNLKTELHAGGTDETRVSSLTFRNAPATWGV